ncbi:MAG: ribbon-helix-helix protein, CopG family [Burkholderiales bacterium]|nr:ribbon-helix-helix protein, CopG family [Burkholderiales bacterium]
MRTTLSLDKDVAAALERVRRARNATLKQIVNEALRQGLARMTAPPVMSRTSFRTESLSLGRCLPGNVDNVAEVLAVAEGERYR